MPKPRSRSAAGLLTCLCVLCGGLVPFGSAAYARDVVVPGSTDFPESMTATSDGTLYFSSFAGGRIFRATPDQSVAAEFIAQGSAGLASATGVLADERSSTLYVCSPDMRWAGIKIPGADKVGALKLFDLDTGRPKRSIALPTSTLWGGKSFCNDIALGADGTAYVTDSLAGHILRLKPGAQTLEVWAHDPRWDVRDFQLDGIAVAPSGSVYANLFANDGLFRIDVNPDGSAGKITKLKTSRPLFHADGLRSVSEDTFLMVEGETKGTLDLVTVSGDSAQIDTIRAGFEGPVSLAKVGHTVYVLDVPLKYLFDPDKKTQQPPPFAAKAVELSN